MASFKPGSEPDTVRFEFEDADGGLNVATLDLHQAAAMQRGETVAGFGLTTYFTLEERVAIAQADLQQIAAEKEEMETEYPGIADGEWSE